MPGDQRTLFVNEHRVGEAKFADRGSDLRYLLVAMSASIPGIRDQPTERPPLDLVGRPRPLILGLASPRLARGRAHALPEWKCWRFYAPADPLQAALRLAPLIIPTFV